MCNLHTESEVSPSLYMCKAIESSDGLNGKVNE